MKLIECVPNISEGRNKDVLNTIVSTLQSNKRIDVLDVDTGHDTNRTVLTFVGKPDDVIDAAFKLISQTYELIDMRNHKGAHPRMGATDVCPLIPISNVSEKECIKYSKLLAQKVTNSLNIPIYMYEKSASNKSRENLANIRQGEYEGFKDKIKSNEWQPDYGKPKYNPKFGCVAIGSREFLIAYNINLNTNDKKIATDIALDIREKGRLKRDSQGVIMRNKEGIADRVPGKFNFCKAVGWYIDEYNQAQVSINLTNYKKTSIHKVFEEVRKQARKRGVRVTGSEIVGLTPKKAIYDAGIFYLKSQRKQLGLPEKDIIRTAVQSLGLNDVSDFKINEKIIEYKVASDYHYPNMNLSNFINSISRPTPTPGGGSVAAFGGAIGASLAAMVSNLTIAKKGFEKHINFHNDRAINCQKNINKLLVLIDKDSQSYDKVLSTYRLPSKTKNQINYKNKAIEEAVILAAETPLEVLNLCNTVISDALEIAKECNPNSISDIAVSAEFLKASAKSASYNVLINANDLKKSKRIEYEDKTDYYLKNVDDSYIKLLNIANIIINKKTND